MRPFPPGSAHTGSLCPHPQPFAAHPHSLGLRCCWGQDSSPHPAILAGSRASALWENPPRSLPGGSLRHREMGLGAWAPVARGRLKTPSMPGSSLVSWELCFAPSWEPSSQTILGSGAPHMGAGREMLELHPRNVIGLSRLHLGPVSPQASSSLSAWPEPAVCNGQHRALKIPPPPRCTQPRWTA